MYASPRMLKGRCAQKDAPKPSPLLSLWLARKTSSARRLKLESTRADTGLMDGKLSKQAALIFIHAKYWTWDEISQRQQHTHTVYCAPEHRMNIYGDFLWPEISWDMRSIFNLWVSLMRIENASDPPRGVGCELWILQIAWVKAPNP